MISTPGHRVPDGGVQTRPSSYRLVNMSFRLSSSAKSRPTVLLVDDDPETSGLLTGLLAESGFRSLSASGGSEMDAVLAARRVDLILLDIMLPGEDGLSICRRLRATSWIPIILLTALGAEVDRVVGLEVGADDYVTKPFSPRELVARIRALLRRAAAGPGAVRERRRVYRFAGWQIDAMARQLTSPAGVHVGMTSMEFQLLLALVQHAGQVLSREQLLALAHRRVAGSIERSIDVHISRIRQKIEPDPRDPSFIKTVRFGGYIFTPTVEEG